MHLLHADVAAAAGEEEGTNKMSEEGERLMEQMRGAETGLYIGCPVLVRVDGGDGWDKGRVTSWTKVADASGEDGPGGLVGGGAEVKVQGRVGVKLSNGRDVSVASSGRNCL